MSRYDALTEILKARDEPLVRLSFDDLDAIVGGLPPSARAYRAWWANNRASQPHAKAWLDAGRRATPDFGAGLAAFVLADTVPSPPSDSADVEEEGQQILAGYVESTISLERDLEDHLVNHLEQLESGLTLISRQRTLDVGRLDILARGKDGRTVIVELKVGEAKDSAVGQIARYIGWFAKNEAAAPRAILVAASFSEAVKYAAVAISSLRLVTYRVSFDFLDATLQDQPGQ
jgi:hypothetical protein